MSQRGEKLQGFMKNVFRNANLTEKGNMRSGALHTNFGVGYFVKCFELLISCTVQRKWNNSQIPIMIQNDSYSTTNTTTSIDTFITAITTKQLVVIIIIVSI